MVIKKEGTSESLFSYLDEKKFERFKKCYPAKKVIFNEGDTAKKFFILVKGSLAVMQGERRLHTIKSPGNVFGEMSTLLNQPRSATVVTNKYSEVVELSGDELTGMAKLSADISLGLAKILAKRLSLTTEAAMPWGEDYEGYRKFLRYKTEYRNIVNICKMVYKDTLYSQIKSIVNFAESNVLLEEDHDIYIDTGNFDSYLKRIYRAENPDRVIFKEGDTSEDIYILKRGEAVVLKGDSKVYTIKNCGSIFGEISPLLGKPRSATILAGKKCETSTVSANKLKEMISFSPEIGLSLAKTIAQRLLLANKVAYPFKRVSFQDIEKVKSEYQNFLSRINVLYTFAQYPQLKSILDFAQKSLKGMGLNYSFQL